MENNGKYKDYISDVKGADNESGKLSMDAATMVSGSKPERPKTIVEFDKASTENINQNSVIQHRERPRTIVEFEISDKKETSKYIDGEGQHAERPKTIAEMGVSTKERPSTHIEESLSKTERPATLVEENKNNDSVFSELVSHIMSAPKSVFDREIQNITVLIGQNGNQYTVREILDNTGGESVIIKCTSEEGESFAAKVFASAESQGQHSIEAREKVFAFMKTDAGKRSVLEILDYGIVHINDGVTEYHHYFEIMPYCKDGDMANRGKRTFDEMLPIIEELNESIHSIHEAGILHLDIKPENLYKIDDRILIGDFGIARTTALNYTSTALGTDGFRAPELLMNPARSSGQAYFHVGSHVDYYAFGVTIACIYEGHYIYQDMDNEQMSAAYVSQLPIQWRNESNHERILKLIERLTQFDWRDRFTYEDVKRWLVDHDYEGSTRKDGIWTKKFWIDGKSYCSSAEVFEALTKNAEVWETGKELLYEGDFEEFFKSFQTDLTRKARSLRESCRNKDTEKKDEDAGLAFFLKSLYKPGPIVWCGHTWHSLSELASEMMKAENQRNNIPIMKNGIISYWIENTAGITYNPETINLIREIESTSLGFPEISCYWFGFTFAKSKELRLNDCCISDITELFTKLFASANTFYNISNFYELLLDPKKGAKIFAFLCSYGYWQSVLRTLEDFKGKSERAKYNAVLMLLEQIGKQERIDMGCFERFYLNFGPQAYAYQTVMLQKTLHVYQPLTYEGKKIIEQMEKIDLPNPSEILTCMEDVRPLCELTDKIAHCMQNNPFLANAGIYLKEDGNRADIICKNMLGYFCYDFIGKKAPLTLEQVISED